VPVPAPIRAAGPTVRWARRGLTVAVAAGLLVAVGTGTAVAGGTPDPSPAPSSPAPSSPAPSGSPGPGTVAPAPDPAVPDGLPAALEDPSPYLRQVSCDPVAKPGATALGRLLVATYPGTSFGVGRACGADGIASEHYEGRAVDWMTPGRDPLGAARAAAVLRWLLAPDAQGHPFALARRLGVMYLIWDDHIWGSYAAEAGWRPYATCASHPDPSWDTACHRDHIHVSLSWAGATGRTSFWTRHVAATDYGPCRPADLNWAAPYATANPVPCPARTALTAPAGAPAVEVALVRDSGATVGPGSTGPVVTAVQRALGVDADGQFGAATAAALTAFRAAHGLPVGTTVDAATWRALLAAAAAPPTQAGALRPPPPPAGPLTLYRAQTLHYGSTGAAVRALQVALHVTPSGWFGPLTQAAVSRVQAAHHLPVTGIVDAATWLALGA